jgi:hypothetical protein
MVGTESRSMNMIRATTALIIVLVVVCACFVSAEREKKTKYTIQNEHPRLYLAKNKLEEVRKRCGNKSGAQAKYYAVIKEFADKFSIEKQKMTIPACFYLAFAYAVGEIEGYNYSKRPIAEYGRLGVSILTQLRPPEDLAYFFKYTPMLIACYDWLFPAMTPDERAKVFANFTEVGDKMRDLLKKPLGRFRGTREMYAYYGLAFYGDGGFMYPDDPKAAAEVDRKAKEYTDFFATWHRDQQLVILESACNGGAYSPGTMYGETFFPNKLWHIDAWDTASTDNLYKTTTSLTGYPLFWMYQMVPYRTQVRFENARGRIDLPGGIVRFGDYRYLGFTSVGSARINTAQAQGVALKQGNHDLSSVFNWLVQYNSNNEFKISPFGGPVPVDKRIVDSPDLVWDIIFRDGLVEAKSPHEAGLPLAYHFGSTDSGPALQPDFPHGRPEGGGIVVMRSSWEDQDGTLLWFKASSHFLIHAHRDQGSFQIYKKGWLGIDSGQYEETPHHGNYSMRTVAHNSLLIYQPDERMDKDKTDSIWVGYANDGGQRWVAPTLTAADTKDSEHYLGGITKFETVAGIYDYINADITRSYNSVHLSTKGHQPKVSSVTRSILFLRPDEFVVIFDRVNSTKAEYPKRWLLHSIYRPELDGTESFMGTIPFSDRIPGKPEGVRLRGDKSGGISESKDTNIFTIRGWNFGPSDGRLVCRTLLPEKHITRIVGGSDHTGERRTVLARPYKKEKNAGEGGAITVANSEGFDIDDFVYVGETTMPYSYSNWGSPHWPVDDVLYQGWGRIQNIDKKSNTIAMVPYGSRIPALPEGSVVVRSGHANRKAYEFMDAEYTQWPMYGEGMANAGPFNMQHGIWRIEVEPVEQKTDNVFLHVMLPCDKDTLTAGRTTLNGNIKVKQHDNSIALEIKGKDRIFSVVFQKDSSDAHIKVTENNRTLLNNELTRDTIKPRTNIPKK